MAEIPVPEHSSAEIPRTEVDDVTLSRILRCDERTVRKYASMGIIRRTGRNRYALFPSIGGVVEYYRQLAAGHGTADAMKANAALKAAQTRLVDLRFEQESGRLISIEEVEAVWSDLGQACKWLFLSVPQRMRFEMPHLPAADIETVERLCLELLREAAFAGKPQLPKQTGGAGEDEGEDEGE